jgi:hypothetical protein
MTGLIKALSIAISFESLNTNYEVRIYSNTNKHKKI